MSNARRKRRTPTDPKVELRIRWRFGGRNLARLIVFASRGRAEKLAQRIAVKEAHYRVDGGDWQRA